MRTGQAALPCDDRPARAGHGAFAGGARALAVLLAAGCGGTWSNGDLAYVAGLAPKASLQLRVAGGGALMGPGTEKDPLAVGEPSALAAASIAGAQDFDRLIDFVFSAQDVIRGLAPTGRSDEGLRVWGPYPDAALAGAQFQVAVTATASAQTFLYRLQVQPTGGAFFDTVTGSFTAGDGVGRSRGTFTFEAGSVQRSLPTANVPPGLERVTADWATDAVPATVDLVVEASEGFLLSPSGYRARVGGDGSGALAFSGRSADAGFDLDARFEATGAGSALRSTEATSQDGGAATPRTERECWDAQRAVRFARQDFDGGVTVGSEGACP